MRFLGRELCLPLRVNVCHAILAAHARHVVYALSALPVREWLCRLTLGTLQPAVARSTGIDLTPHHTASRAWRRCVSTLIGAQLPPRRAWLELQATSEAGTLPPFLRSSSMTRLCSQIFMFAVSSVEPV